VFNFNFSGPQLLAHFANNSSNLKLRPEDQLSFISYPVFVWSNPHIKDPSSRHVGDFKLPLDYFDAMWSEWIVNHLCQNIKPFYLNKVLTKVTPSHVYRLLGQELMRGYIGVRNIKDMWGDGEISISHPCKENQLPKNLFFALSSRMDFKPKVVHKLLVDAFKLHLVPGFNVTVDEIRIPCSHETCPIKNHNRAKPDIWAIESKSLHAENGYLLDFIDPCQKKIPTPSESVFQFAEWLKSTERRHHVVADSNFLSALDILKLYDMGFEATVSCKGNRPSFIWREGLSLKLPQSYTRVASNDRMCCLATHNQRKPKIATTRCSAFDDENSSDVKKRRDVLKLFDDLKGKADYFGHLYKAQYTPGHHVNWLTTLIFGWFYFAITNAFILYSMRSDELTHKEFVFKIAKNLLMM